MVLTTFFFSLTGDSLCTGELRVSRFPFALRFDHRVVVFCVPQSVRVLGVPLGERVRRTDVTLVRIYITHHGRGLVPFTELASTAKPPFSSRVTLATNVYLNWYSPG